ncbi:hypothetical protein [Streptomyces coeruleorubidus]|jgi:hypothetical protein|uniref:hypothetical protein n=1 Tax=Streptomyces coeruleorubidus TaxID=116188 RepID=UPI0033BC5F6E
MGMKNAVTTGIQRLRVYFLWALNLHRFRWVLVVDGVTFPATAIADLVMGGSDQAITGLLRIAVGVINWVAWFDVRRHLRATALPLQPWGLPSVIAGQASTIPFLWFPFWIELSGDLHDLIDISLLIFAGALFVIAATVTLGAIIGRQGSLTVTWGIVVALLPFLGILQFWYMTFYRPAHERPRVNAIAELDEVRVHGGVSQMRGTVTLESVGEAELDVLGAFYAVTDHEVGAVGHVMRDGEVSKALKRSKVVWRDDSTYRGVLEVGRLIRHGGRLTPGQKLKTSFVFDVKNSPQRKLRLSVFLSLVNREGDLREFAECISDDSYVCFETELPSQSLLRYTLGDSPKARVAFLRPSKDVPVPQLVTSFLAVSWDAEANPVDGEVRKIDIFRDSRGVTSSVEYRLDP